MKCLLSDRKPWAHNPNISLLPPGGSPLLPGVDPQAIRAVEPLGPQDHVSGELCPSTTAQHQAEHHQEGGDRLDGEHDGHRPAEDVDLTAGLGQDV